MAEKCTNKYKHYSLRRRHRPGSSKHVPQKKHSLTGSRAPHSIRTAAALFFALLALQNLLEKKGGQEVCLPFVKQTSDFAVVVVFVDVIVAVTIRCHRRLMCTGPNILCQKEPKTFDSGHDGWYLIYELN